MVTVSCQLRPNKYEEMLSRRLNRQLKMSRPGVRIYAGNADKNTGMIHLTIKEAKLLIRTLQAAVNESKEAFNNFPKSA